MKKDATFKWDDKDFVNFYTDSANFIVLERQRSIRILLEIIAFHFPSLSDLHILDLGCGEGIITKYIYDKSPNNHFYLVDASEEMLTKAKANLRSSKISYCCVNLLSPWSAFPRKRQRGRNGYWAICRKYIL